MMDKELYRLLENRNIDSHCSGTCGLCCFKQDCLKEITANNTLREQSDVLDYVNEQLSAKAYFYVDQDDNTILSCKVQTHDELTDKEVKIRIS